MTGALLRRRLVSYFLSHHHPPGLKHLNRRPDDFSLLVLQSLSLEELSLHQLSFKVILLGFFLFKNFS